MERKQKLRFLLQALLTSRQACVRQYASAFETIVHHGGSFDLLMKRINFRPAPASPLEDPSTSAPCVEDDLVELGGVALDALLDDDVVVDFDFKTHP